MTEAILFLPLEVMVVVVSDRSYSAASALISCSPQAYTGSSVRPAATIDSFQFRATSALSSLTAKLEVMVVPRFFPPPSLSGFIGP